MTDQETKEEIISLLPLNDENSKLFGLKEGSFQFYKSEYSTGCMACFPDTEDPRYRDPRDFLFDFEYSFNKSRSCTDYTFYRHYARGSTLGQLGEIYTSFPSFQKFLKAVFSKDNTSEWPLLEEWLKVEHARQ